MTGVWQVLAEAGVETLPVDAHRVALKRGRHRATLLVINRERPITPSGVAALAGQHEEPGLLVVPRATAGVRSAAERAGWSLLTTGPDSVRGTLRIGDAVLAIGAAGATARQPARARPGRVPWLSLTVIRRLVEHPGATQAALAGAAGVSQPRVSQVLRPLGEHGMVERWHGGWVVGDFDRLTQHWLRAYPGPGGITTHWYGLESPRLQTQAVVRLLARRARRHTDPVVSGDVAADLIAPWRTPTRAVVYARAGADLSRVGLTPAGPEEATLELIVPRDPGVWPLARVDAELPLADQLQVLWDLRRSSGPETDEAVSKVMDRLRRRCDAAVEAVAAS